MHKPVGIITILLFAQAKEQVGRSSVQVEIATPTSASELKAILSRDYPEIASLIAISRLAVNRSFVAEDCQIDGSEEIAIIPPVSGG